MMKVKDKKQYVYIGQYYHIKNKELPLDYKFGVTDNLDQREYSLGRTKSPIKYMILKAWEIPINVKREKVEKLISTIFSENKYDGCEWYDIDGETFQGKISSLFQIITDMIEDGEFRFHEIELNNNSESDVLEKELEKEIRSGKKAAWTNLKIDVEGENMSSSSAKSSFSNAVRKIIEITGETQFAIDYSKIFKSNIEDFAEYKRNQVEKIGNFYLDCQSSTQMKKSQLEDMLKKYQIAGIVSISTEL